MLSSCAIDSRKHSRQHAVAREVPSHGSALYTHLQGAELEVDRLHAEVERSMPGTGRGDQPRERAMRLQTTQSGPGRTIANGCARLSRDHTAIRLLGNRLLGDRTQLYSEHRGVEHDTRVEPIDLQDTAAKLRAIIDAARRPTELRHEETPALVRASDLIGERLISSLFKPIYHQHKPCVKSTYHYQAMSSPSIAPDLHSGIASSAAIATEHSQYDDKLDALKSASLGCRFVHRTPLCKQVDTRLSLWLLS